MATATRNRALTERLTDVPYVLVGVGDAAAEQVKAVPERVEGVRHGLVTLPQRVVRHFDELAERGRVLSNRIDRDPKVQAARSQTQSAKSKVKGAGTSVGRAAEAQAQAGAAAARKVG